MKRTRSGSTSSNPIIIQDAPDSTSTYIHLPPEQPVLGKTLVSDIQLPRPSRKAIISTLVKMPDVIKVVEELVKLSSSPPTHQMPSFRDAFTNANLKKRRKLNEVPAGAADWDVPFPFEYGHGPKQYMATWVEERRKTLMGQLVALISTATKKAAAKAYCRKHGTKAFTALVNKSKLGSNNEVLSDVLTDTSNHGTPTHSSPATPLSEKTDGQISEHGGLDDLLSSLLATVPSTSFSVLPGVEDGLVPDGSISFNDVESLSWNEGLMDGWTSIFQSFSMPNSGMPVEPSPIPPLRLDLPDPGSTLAPLQLFPATSFNDAIMPPTTSSSSFAPALSPYPYASVSSTAPHTIPDSDIDPLLLSINMSPFSEEAGPSNASPLASQSSLGPLTPQSSAWESGDIFVPESTQAIANFGHIMAEPAEDTVAAVRSILQHKPAKTNQRHPATLSDGTLANPEPRRESKRAAIIQTAKERKRQLEVELERAKIEYWEMAIEQSAMLHLLQKL